MSAMDYVVVSTAVTDDLYLADGAHEGPQLGGAGIYALCGAWPWSKAPVLVTGVGADFEPLHGGWFARSGCSAAGLTVRDPHTPVSVVRYRPDGGRAETPRYGPGHYRRMEALPEDLESFLPGAWGVYIFKDLDLPYWEKVLALRARFGFSLMWEINADAAVPENLAQVRALARRCGLFSINSAEASALLGTADEAALTEELLAWDAELLYLRMGGNGAAVLSGGRAVRVPCAPCRRVADPTGAGNSSTAAVLCGWCQGASPRACGVMGAISAARCIEQYGPPELTPALRAQCVRDRAQMLGETEESQ